MVVNPKLFGTAFGLMEMLQNLALACFPLLASVIQHTIPDRKEGFKRQTMFYFGISVVCLIFGVVLAIIDRVLFFNDADEGEQDDAQKLQR